MSSHMIAQIILEIGSIITCRALVRSRASIVMDKLVTCQRSFRIRCEITLRTLVQQQARLVGSQVFGDVLLQRSLIRAIGVRARVRPLRVFVVGFLMGDK